jgi:recombinational DNA repair protein RecT
VQGYWAGFVLTNGGRNFEYWTVEEIEEHRDRYSQSAWATTWNDDKRRKEFILEDGHKVLQGPWATAPDWMYRKTPLKQVLKLGPQSYELAIAHNLDDLSEQGKHQTFSVEVPLELNSGFEEDDDSGEWESGRGSRASIVMPQRTSETKAAEAEVLGGAPKTPETDEKPAQQQPEKPKPAKADKEKPRNPFLEACDSLRKKHPLRFDTVLGFIGYERPEDVPAAKQSDVLGELGKELEK